MFEKLIDLLVQLRDSGSPVFTVDCYEKASVLRFGKFHRAAEPGLHWKIPFVEKYIEVVACETTWRSPAQPLTTKDDAQVSISTVVRYEITDVKAYITKIYDQKDVLADRTMGLVRRHVAKHTYRELVDSEDPESAIATALRRAVNKYGFVIHEVTFTSFTRARPYMLISQSAAPKDLDN